MAILEFSDAQTFSSRSSGNHNNSTDVIDLGASGTDGWGTSLANRLGGTDLKWHLQVNVAVSGSSATLLCELKTHTAVSMKSAGTVIMSHVIPASSAVGYRRAFSLPLCALARYVRVNFTPTGGNIGAASAIDSWLGPDTGDMPKS